MALIKTDEVTIDFVLSKVDEASIFASYYPGFQMRRHFSSPFRRDSEPSCRFRFNRVGKLVFTDFGEAYSLDCFAFVGKMEGLSYRQAVTKVACDLGLIKCNNVKNFTKREIKKAEVAAERIKQDTQIDFTIGKWDRDHLSMWERLSINTTELEREKIYPVEKLYISGKFITNWRNELRYAYTIEVKDKVYKKIYTPFTTEKQFKWISNIPHHIPFGIMSLSKATNFLIIAKSQKERLLFQKFFPDVIALQAENPAALKEITIKYINDNYDRAFVFMDADEAGRRATEHFIRLGYTGHFIPSAVQEEGLKDWAEFVENYGIDAMEIYLKNLKLI